ncbi:MAG: pyridoxal phosphate-dependent decarboxylase family protein [Longimicrobiaceae bacterium]
MSAREEPAGPLLLSARERGRLWEQLAARVEDYTRQIPRLRVAPELDPEAVRSELAPFDFTEPLEPERALDFAARGLVRYQTHTPHPGYFGLFNPAPTFMGVVGDALVAAFNPQLAAWSHSPLAIEIEHHLVRAFGRRFGWPEGSSHGTFCSGGAEANHTALLTALVHHFPELPARGLRGLEAEPVLYASAEAHHSIRKAAAVSGLGTEAAREVGVDAALCMKPAVLAGQVQEDLDAGREPFLVVATAGTTNAGAVDRISEIAEIAERHKLWLHVDAAWGGAAALVPELRGVLAGIDRADSITFDAHKWLSVPMGAGVYLTRHREILRRTFATDNFYMPREASHLPVEDPFNHSLQWSRRFTGLKLFLSLAVAGWDGYARVIRHQVQMGDLLREELKKRGWKLRNQTPLPVVCFTPPGAASPEELEALAGRVLGSGRAWISTTRLGDGETVLRACVTNYRTGPDHVRELVEVLERAR